MALLADLWRRPTGGSRYVIVGIAVTLVLLLLVSRSDVADSVRSWHPVDTSSAGNNPASQGGQQTKTPEAAKDNGGPMAVVIETEMTPNLIPLMLHFSNVLGPVWTVVLFTLQDKWTDPTSVPFRRAIADKRIEIRFLPVDTVLKDSGSVSRFLTMPWLWEQTESASRVLLFQTDSVICSKSERTVDDYLEYDFLGAPIASQYGQGYNGGLSIRNPKLFLKITKESNFQTSGSEFEDQWFFKEVQSREGSKLPSEEVAKTFSVETIYYETPLGYHQPARWQAGKMSEIEAWCPEVKMLVGRRAT